MKIVLAGGGTLGSVSPLVAVWQILEKQTKTEAYFIGTTKGPEKAFLSQYPSISFKTVPAGKLRRYFSFKNLIDFFVILAGFIKAVFLLKRIKPDIVLAAGSYVSVPVLFAAKGLGIKTFIQQLDLEPTLSNLLVRKIVDKIAVTFSESKEYFPYEKTIVAGSAIRQEIINLSDAESYHKNILILGGGTGAKALNKLVGEMIKKLPQEIQINHVTGKGKGIELENYPNYRQFEFLTHSYYQKINKADLVISRAGLSTLTELAYLGKPAIIIPMPGTHQEKNAEYFLNHRAVVSLKQKELNGELLADKIRALLADKEELRRLSQNIKNSIMTGGEEKIAQTIIELIRQ
jgi:UDP-N-acetylglucosamine--N-acetylmuramyl-(pentapeptide) pyrophosphoryl-undecaprenol N-acetylglucosamine transferase